MIECFRYPKRGNRGCKAIPPEVRFEESYIPEPNSGCWLWVGYTNNHGYGHIWNGLRMVQASRFSWTLYNKSEIPKGKFALHKCDTPACVNPNHIYIGTMSDNVRDMINRGRNSRGTSHAALCADRRGENNTQAKLSSEDVKCIRATPPGSRGWKTSLAKSYGISPAQITHILSRSHWND